MRRTPLPFIRPALVLVEVDNGEGNPRWKELGHRLGVDGLAVTQTELEVDGGPWRGWTLTHLASGRSLGVYAETKEKIAEVASKLEGLPWTKDYERLSAERAQIVARVRDAAKAAGLSAVAGPVFSSARWLARTRIYVEHLPQERREEARAS